jgi:hypothetical protein
MIVEVGRKIKQGSTKRLARRGRVWGGGSGNLPTAGAVLASE